MPATSRAISRPSKRPEHAEQFPTGLFITGTDTGVGKTVVTAALTAILRRGGIDAVPMKPVQTGCLHRNHRLVAPDLEQALRLAGVLVTERAKADLALYRFIKPCSPHLAAECVQKMISIRCIQRAFQRLTHQYTMVLVEGAGGVLAPLDRRRTMLDLMAALGLPVVLVARPGLGTINHTLLSINALRGAGLRIFGLMMNAAQPSAWGMIEQDNVRIIEKLGRVRVLGRLSWMPRLGQYGARAFSAACARHLPEPIQWRVWLEQAAASRRSG